MKVTIFFNKIELTLKEYRTSEFIVTNCRKLNKKDSFSTIGCTFSFIYFLPEYYNIRESAQC